MDLSRRTILAAAGAAPAVGGMALAADARPDDEAYWGKVATLFDAPPPGVIQLENGYFGAMARSTRAAFERNILRVNRETSIYARDAYNADLEAVRARCAKLLQVDADEIAFTRGGTESMVTLIGGYNRLKPGDAVLYADLDYDSMKVSMAALERVRGVRVVRIDLPEPASRQNLIDAYERALAANPDVRLMLLTHLSNRTGLVPPVKEIVALAKARGVDVLLDSGHALGQTEFTLRDLGVEFAGLGLHKWIGAPVGLGMVYIRKDRIPDIDVSILEAPGNPRIDARVHTGTVSFAAMLTVPDAIAAHEAIGLAPKARRLRYLRDRWAEVIRGHPGVEVLTPPDPALHAGITSFRLTGRTSMDDNRALRARLFERYRIFTIERAGVAKGCCIRVSPSFVNTAAQMDALAAALRDLA